jgi:hypothetical protein
MVALRHRFGAALAVGLSFLGAFGVGAAAESARVEAFKSFLSTPPAVQSVVFSERQPPDPQHPSRLDLPLASSRSFRYYEGRFQSDAFLLRELAMGDALSDSKAFGLLAANDGASAWFHQGVDRRGAIVEFGTGITNEVRRSAHVASHKLRQVLTLGIMRCAPGTLEWHGDKFRVTRPDEGLSAWGDLHTSENGAVDSLNATYRLDSGDVHWKIRYAYGETNMTGLPSEIRCFLLLNGAEVEIAEFTIYQLRLAAEPLISSAFSPEKIIADKGWDAVTHTNHGFYLLAGNGSVRKLNISESFSPLDRNRSHLARVPPGVYAAWAGANATIFVLALRMRAKIVKSTKQLNV